MDKDKPIRIDISAVLSERLGRRARYVPAFVIRAIERLIRQDELNRLLDSNFPLRDAEFCDGVLCDLDVKLNIVGAHRLPESSRCIIASNHPLGGLDGIAMIAWLSRHYGRTARFVVNDLLMAVEPLTDCFIPVNKHGGQSRAATSRLDSALAGDDPVVIYPAGLVSRLHEDGTISDLEWNKMFVTKAIESRRDIVPVHFDGRNSESFYRLARWRKRLGLKFNYEMILLPREVFNSSGSTFTLTVGTPIPWQELRGGPDAIEQAAKIRAAVYRLPQTHRQK